ncbi:MAG: radical SAM protein [Propionicimonas sp.]
MTRGRGVADVVVDGLVGAFLQLDHLVLGRRVSRTGYANPRVRQLVGTYGYSVLVYRITRPNIVRWLAGDTDLFPAAVQVQTINRCNGACEFCPYPYTVAEQDRRVMDDALFSAVARECAAESELCCFVPMSKNEPLLDARLEERIAEFRRQAQPHQVVEVVTNGTGLTPQRASALIDAGTDLITVSVNAYSRSTYERVMKGLSWSTVMRNLEALAQMDLSTTNVYLRFVGDRSNRTELRAFRRRWRRFNLFQFSVNNRAGTVRDYQRLSPKRADGPKAWLRRAGGSRVYPVCPYLFSLAHVLENGDVPMCSNDWLNREVLGNVATQSLREIFNGERMNELRTLMAQGRFEEIDACRECSFYRDWMKRPGTGG